MGNLRSEKSSILELNKETKDSRMPRIDKEACFMEPVVNTTKERATLEAELRFCSNEGLS